MIIIGGTQVKSPPGDYYDQILKYEPAGDSLDPGFGTMPIQVGSRIGACEYGGNVYHFGGMVPGGKTDSIYRIDGTTGAVEELATTLPWAWDGGGVVCTEHGEAYILGGATPSVFALDAIVRYDIEADTIAELAIVLPQPSKGTAAVYTGDAIYVFGGVTGTGSPMALDTIVRVVP